MKTVKSSLAWYGIASAAVMFSACASTQLKTSFRSPDFVPTQMKKVLIIGTLKKSENRELLEDSFVQAFAKHGTPAIASYTVMPDESQVDEAALQKLLTEQGFDAVLIGRLVGVQSTENGAPAQGKVTPPSWTRNYGSYYSRGTASMGGSYAVDHAFVETKLYGVAGNTLLWSGESQTNLGDRSRLESIIRDFARKATRAIYN